MMIEIVAFRRALVALTGLLLCNNVEGQAIQYKDALNSNTRRGLRHHLQTGSRQLQNKNNVTVQLFVYNTMTDKRVAMISNGTVLNLRALGLNSAAQLNYEGVVVGNVTVGSLKFSLNNGTYTRLETGAPFAMCGNSGPDYLPCPWVKLGKQTIQAIPYSLAGANGTILTNDNTFTFEIINVTETPPANTSTCTVPKVRQFFLNLTFLSKY